MHQFKDYTGSVYGGLGHLLYTYSQAKGLAISEKLEQVQNLERFDFCLWRELLTDVDQHLKIPALGLEIAEYVQPKHLGIIAYIALSCNTLGEALYRYHDLHRLIYDGSPLQADMLGDYLAIGWGSVPFHLTTQVSNEIAICRDVSVPETFYGNLKIFIFMRFTLPIRHPRMSRYTNSISIAKSVFLSLWRRIILPVAELAKPFRQGDQTLQHLLMQQAQALLDKLPNSPN